MTDIIRKPQKKPYSSEDKITFPDLYVTVRNDMSKKKFTRIDFSFLGRWLGTRATAVTRAIEIYVRNQVSSTPAYSIRKVLSFWNDLQRSSDLPIFTSLEIKPLEQQISLVRYEFFKFETSMGRALVTTYGRWQTFLRFLEVLSIQGVLPPIRINAPALVTPPWGDVFVERDKTTSTLKHYGPRSMDHDADSYHVNLFEDLSIVYGEDEYIDEYTARLESAVNKIRECALKDFNEMRRKRNEFDFLVGGSNAAHMDGLKENVRKRNYTDPESGLHILEEQSNHPKLLSNLLYIVATQMDGIPKPHFKFSADGKCLSSSLNPHWHFIGKYGKNRLLPYLGIMDAFALGTCLVILMLELPRINATSLIRARLMDPKGRQILISTSGEGLDGELTITVQKPRAGEEKTTILTPLAQEVMELVLEWTQPIRDVMINEGRNDEASWLWVGMAQNNYNLIHYSYGAAFHALRLDEKYNARGVTSYKSRGKAFLERHPCLEPWKKRITYKSLRLNVGVLEYLKTGGDLVATARIFGHKKIETTINNYIPRPLRNAMYERQIRRHQNRLIVECAENEEQMVRYSDFDTVEELHIFLNSHPMTSFSNEENSLFDTPELTSDSARANGRVVIFEDPTALAIAMLYSEHLKSAPLDYLSTPDKDTGIAPQFWVDFIGAVSAPLPLGLANVTNIVTEAKRRASDLKNGVKFPRFDH